MSIAQNDFKALESRHSPEGRAQAVRAASIKEMWAQDHYLPDPFIPTVAELAAMNTDKALSIAHAKVLRTLFRFSEDGRRQLHASIPEPACDYLAEIVRYLTSIGAGIKWTTDDLDRDPFFDAVCGSPDLPDHMRDVTATMMAVLMHPSYGEAFHQDVLGSYFDAGYISDDPVTRKLPPPRTFDTWLNFLAFVARPTAVSMLLERGVDLSAQPTPQVIFARKMMLQVEREAETPEGLALTRRLQESLEGIKPGNYIEYFKLFSVMSSTRTYRDSPLCMQAVAELESAEMVKSIIGRVKSSSLGARP